MKAPGFWQAGRGGVLAFLLAPFGQIYGQITLNRLKKSGWRADIPVMSIGNFTAGGAGKTPTALALAEALKARGERPAFLTRGYGGQIKGPVEVIPARHNAADVGDEAMLLAAQAPTFVGRNRAEAARLARATKPMPTCLILDDGLQNPHLEKDFSLAVVDGGFGLGNGHCIPAGPLRAPMIPMLKHIDALLTIGEGREGEEAAKAARIAGKPCFASRFDVPDWARQTLAGQRVFAFAGIGRPDKFFTTVTECGAELVQTCAYPDHHIFSDFEAEALILEAQAMNAMLVTTQKDHVRLRGSIVQAELAEACFALPVSLPLEEGLIDVVQEALRVARKRISTASGPA
jgi:tetraacyldisaccharide 4'-kinase